MKNNWVLLIAGIALLAFMIGMMLAIPLYRMPEDAGWTYPTRTPTYLSTYPPAVGQDYPAPNPEPFLTTTPPWRPTLPPR